MRSALLSALFAGLLAPAVCLPGQTVNAVDVKPSPQQVHWQDLEFGVIVHFGTNTFLNREWGDGTADPKVFNPTQADPDQWLKAAKAAGATYVVLVAKHHDGFCLFPNRETDYTVAQSPWLGGKGDLVRMTSDAAKKEGMGFGVYLSPWDRHDTRYKDAAAYDQYYLKLLEVLSTRYGNLTELWLDGAGSEGHVYDFKKIIETLRTYQPNTIVFSDMGLFDYGDARWVGSERGDIPYENWNVIDRHGYLRWRPVESDTTLRKEHWFWHPNDEASLKPVNELVDLWERTVGHGGQLMLGLAPDDRGLMPDVDVARLKEMGEAIQARYGSDKNLAIHHVATDANAAAALDGDADTFWSAPAGSHHAVLEVTFGKPVTFNHTLTMEWLNDGQHVEKYAIEAWDGTRWNAVAGAAAIGHKKIDIFPAVTATKVRLHVISSTSEAHIREFQIFNVPAS